MNVNINELNIIDKYQLKNIHLLNGEDRGKLIKRLIKFRDEKMIRTRIQKINKLKNKIKNYENN